MKKIILTYGTFDVLHVGHIRLLERARALGDSLIVGLSTDEFNAVKNKQAFYSYADRAYALNALTVVDSVISERTWDQKLDDIRKYDVSVVVMGDDWSGDERFESLKEICEVVYLPRTKYISSSFIKEQNLNQSKRAGSYV